MGILVSLLAVLGLVSVVSQIFKMKNKDMKKSGQSASQQMKENVTQASESMSQKVKVKVKEKVKQAADNVSQKMSGETRKQGTRYGSNPIRY